MKKTLICICLFILLSALLLGAFGCGRSVKGDVRYTFHAYDMKSASFVKLDASVTFNDDLTEYEYVFDDGSLTIRGAAARETGPDRFTLSCSEDVANVLKDRYKQRLIEAGASEEELADFEIIKQSFSSQMQLFVFNGYLFSASSVELFHAADQKKSDAFEGNFIMTATGKMTNLHGGVMYTEDDKGDFTVKAGYYTVSNGIMTVTTTDAEGKDSYVNGVLARKKYLMATVTFADEFELIDTDFEDQVNGSEWIKLMKGDISAYSGKKYAVLTDEFYAADFD